MLILLSEADRERLGAPEKLVVKLADITAREQGTLQHAFGYHDTMALGDAWDAMFEREDNGEVARVRKDSQFFLALTWLALRQNGLLAARTRADMAAELDDLDIQINRLDFALDDEEKAEIEATKAAEQGKGEGSTPTETSTT